MILENPNRKVNPKKNIYLFSWILEVDKIVGQKLGFGSWGGIGGKGRWRKSVEQEN